jgi:hypothetical protein
MNIKQGDRGMPAQAARSFSLEKARPSTPQLNDPFVELAERVTERGWAMQCFAPAAIKDQTDLGVEVNINRASRLMRTFAGQVEALKKYRSQREQHCTVEHVHVHSGGQAVVGSLNHQSTRTDDRQRAQEGKKPNGEP